MRLYGGGVSDDIDKAENYHAPGKWNQKVNVMPYLIGPVLLNLDGDHRANYGGQESLVSHLLEYFYLPSLGVSIPVVHHVTTKGLGLLGNIVPVGENAFYAHTQQAKMLFGGLGAYGKLFERVSALRHSEGLTDSYVAEDIESAIRYMGYGYVVGRAGYIKTEKGWPFQMSALRNRSGEMVLRFCRGGNRTYTA